MSSARQVSFSSDEMTVSQVSFGVYDEDCAFEDDGDNCDDYDEGFDLTQQELSDFVQQYTQPNLDDVFQEKEEETEKLAKSRDKDNMHRLHGIDQEVSTVRGRVKEKQQITLTQSFLSKTPSKRKSQSLATTSEKKRQKRNQQHQQTLTQNLESRSPAGVDNASFIHSKIQFKDTDEKVYVSFGAMLKVFKIGEAYEINHHFYRDSIFVIESFKTKGATTKYAVGHVYQRLKRTYIGGISENLAFKKYLNESNLDLNQYARHKDEIQIALRFLKAEVVGFEPPSRFIVYENFSPSSKNVVVDGHGFTISYRHSKCAGKKIDDSRGEGSDDFINTKLDEKFERKNKERTAEANVKIKGSIDPSTHLNCNFEQRSISPRPFELLNQAIADLSKKFGARSIKKLKEATLAVENESSDLEYSLAGAEADLKSLLGDQTIGNLEQKAKKKIKVLDFFAGIGGMSSGFIAAGGYDVKWAVEKNPGAAAMFRLNHDGSILFEEDVLQWLCKMEQEVARCQNPHENNPYMQTLQAEHLHFSPKFSMANRQKGKGKNDEANAFLTLFCIDIIKFFFQHGSVKSVSMENVTGLLSKHNENENYLKTVVTSLISIGMDVRISVLDASRYVRHFVFPQLNVPLSYDRPILIFAGYTKRYGDPQKRKRVFVTACKQDLSLHRFPNETHDKEDIKLLRLVTTVDALGAISRAEPTVGNGFVEVIDNNGSRLYVQNHCRAGTAITNEDNLEALIASEPAHTVRRKANIKHYELPRTLTVREMALLQSFGYNFKLCGSPTQQVDGIGNAVPIKVAQAVALAIKDMYNA